MMNSTRQAARAARVLAILGAFSTLVSAHLALSGLPLIPGSGDKSPLDAGGSNFPCHGVDLTNRAKVTQITVGDQLTMEYNLGSSGENTAVHGGGSCQMSLTYETDPAAVRNPNNWKVIFTVTEGCPSNFPGNLERSVKCSGSSDMCVNTFPYKMPPEVQNGKATLAWTWFNNIGNREMYMNCAAVEISGGQNQLDQLPTMMVANLPSVDPSCKTTEGTTALPPNPGKYVSRSLPHTPGTKRFPAEVPKGCGKASGRPGSGGNADSDSPQTADTDNNAQTPDTGRQGSRTGRGGQGRETGGGYGPPTTSPRGPRKQPGRRPNSGAGNQINNGQAGGYNGADDGGNLPELRQANKANAAQNDADETEAEASPDAEQAAPLPADNAAATPRKKPAREPTAQDPDADNADAAKPPKRKCLSDEVACAAEGFFCISESQYGTCVNGCATKMALAPGTTCADGGVADARNFVVPTTPLEARAISLRARALNLIRAVGVMRSRRS